MILETLTLHQSKVMLRKLFRSDSPDCRVVKVAKKEHVYTSGERDSMIYCVESGRVKEVLISPEGKECLLAIHTVGDIFGELCLCGQNMRLETTTAMQDTVLKRIPSRAYISMLGRGSLLENLVQYLASRIADQQNVIATLLTENSEQRLAKTLLRLAHKLGRDEARSTCITQRIRHEELAEMVGTTRSRIGFFLKRFREMGMIDLNQDRCLMVREKKLEEYIDGFEFPYGKETDSFMAPDGTYGRVAASL